LENAEIIKFQVSRGVSDIFFKIVTVLNWKDPLFFVFLFPNGIAGRLGVNVSVPFWGGS